MVSTSTKTRRPLKVSADVAVVGAGYAGCYAIRELRRAGADVVAIDPTGTLDMLPRLGAVAGHAAPATDAAIPLSDLFPGLRIVSGKMAAFLDGAVVMEDESKVVARTTIITAGAEPLSPPISGLKHALPLRTAADALALRLAIGKADHVVVIGGGATGVQLAGAISASRVATVTVIDGNDALLEGFAKPLGAHAEQILSGRGVDVRLGHEVSSISAKSVRLDGETVKGLPVWVGGFGATMDQYNIARTTDGRLNISPELVVEGHSTLFAAGDVAAHTNADGELVPMAAQTAVQAGEGAARNALQTMAGGQLSAVGLRDLGWIVDMSGGRGVAEVGPFRFAHSGLDMVPPFFHDLIDAKTLFELGGVRAVKRFSPGRQSELPAGFDPALVQQYLG